MDFAALQDFNLVARHAGFGRASRASGRPKASLSRRVRELEEQLGVRLIERGAGGLRLTDEGAALHLRTEGPLAEVEEAAADAASAGAEPRGRLRISVPLVFAHTKLGRLAAAFVAAYPQVTLEASVEDRMVDLIAEGYDLVVRTNPRADETLVGRPILRDHRLIVAPPGWARPEAGAVVRAVTLLSAPADQAWRLAQAKGGVAIVLQPQPVLRLASVLMVRDAVLAGAGAAVLPWSLTEADIAAGRLVNWGLAEGHEVTVWALHASRRGVSRKITAFMDLLVADGGVA